MPGSLLPVNRQRAEEFEQQIRGEQGGDRAEPQVRVGMVLSEAQALFGAPKTLINSTFKGQPVVYAVYQTNANGAFGSFTFIAGVLTEFAGGDRMPLSNVFNGG